MSQASPSIGANKSGLQYRGEDNAGKAALLSNHKGNTAPTYATAGMIWVDDNTSPWRIKFFDGGDWIVIGTVNPMTNAFTPFLGTGVLKFINYADDSGDEAGEYIVDPTPSVSTLAVGMTVTLRPGNNNADVSTLNVSGTGNKSIKLTSGGDPHAGALLTTGMYFLVYDGANFVLLNPSYAFGSAAFVDVIDEDDMATDSATRPPSQQSVKAHVAAEIAANAGGAMEFLGAQAIAGAEAIFNDLDDAYEYFVVEFDLVKSSAAQSIRSRVSADNGATWDSSTSNYAGTNILAFDSGTVLNPPGSPNHCELYPGSRPSSANVRYAGQMEVRGLFKAAGYPEIRSEVRPSESVAAFLYKRVHARQNAAAYNAFSLYVASGTLTGYVKLYGVKGE